MRFLVDGDERLEFLEIRMLQMLSQHLKKRNLTPAYSIRLHLRLHHQILNYYLSLLLQRAMNLLPIRLLISCYKNKLLNLIGSTNMA